MVRKQIGTTATCAGTTIGGDGPAAANISIDRSDAQKAMSSINNKLGISSTVTAKIPMGFLSTNLSVTSKYDKMWETTSLTETNASNMSGITIRWPGASGYTSAGGYASEEQQFKADALIYLQPSGGVNVAYGVSQLRRTGVDALSSRLWGMGSPYSVYPDPGLFLPLRFNADGNKNKTAGAYRMRGTTFEPSLFHGVVEIGESIKVGFRVYNYSFVATNETPYEVFFQPLTFDRGGMPEEPSLARATSIHTGKIRNIPGRDESAADNWHDETFTWQAPAREGSGYLHFVLRPEGPELNVDNNYGYVMVGFYNPDHVPAQSYGAQTGAASVSAASISAASIAETLALRVHDLIVRDMNGRVIDPDDDGDYPDAGPFEIELVLALDATADAVVRGTPMVRVDLLVNGEALAASEHATYMENETKFPFRMVFDPKMYRDLVELEYLLLRVSAYLLPANDIDIRDIANGGGNDNSDDNDSNNARGGGGCNAGAAFGALVFIAGLLAARDFRKRRTS